MKPLKYLDLKKPNFKSFIMSPGDVVFLITMYLINLILIRVKIPSPSLFNL